MDLLTFLEAERLQRFLGLYEQTDPGARDQAYLTSWERQSTGLVGLLARAGAFVSEEAAREFTVAVEMDHDFWVVYRFIQLLSPLSLAMR